MTTLKEYVEKFIALDGGEGEFFRKGGIKEFLGENLPVFACDDKTLEEIYYFRAYTFAKHIKRIGGGKTVITEFLPDVPWSAEGGAISCPVGHHLRELRWLKNCDGIGRDYISFWCGHTDDLLVYNNWFIYAVWEYCDMTGQMDFAYSLADALIGYFTRFCEMHRAKCGLYKSVDNYDGMELSISSYGIRPTINAYVYGNAYGLGKILAHGGDGRAEAYLQFAEELKRKIEQTLCRDGFCYALPLEEGEEMPRYLPEFSNPNRKYFVKELIGYVPFYFNALSEGQFGMWKYVVDEKTFLSKYGLTTADRSDEQFGFSFPHMCLWNGPVWPFATSQTLTGLSNALKSGGKMPIGREEYTFLLKQYAGSQYRKTERGIRPWIDENLDGETGEWLARKIMYERGAPDKDRGVDYNHSTFLDLILNGLCGADVKDGKPEFKPQASGVSFSVTGLRLAGREYDCEFDGKNFHVTA